MKYEKHMEKKNTTPKDECKDNVPWGIDINSAAGGMGNLLKDFK